MKCLLFIRVSTNRQEVESQLKETKEFAESLGFDEFVILEKKGASAFKVADEYVEMLDEMKLAILKDSSIKAVVVYAMNRLFRNDKIAVELKEWFVENKIQLYIKEPRLKLLEDDGSISDGNEMIFHFFAVFNKQQILELKAKSRRAKARDKSIRKYIGGTLLYGYKLDENKFIVVDEAKAKIVFEIFQLYASGKYSLNTLKDEINERYGLNLNRQLVNKIITTDRYYTNTTYPQIISKELFDKANESRTNNQCKTFNTKHFYFGSRVMKCSKCKSGYTANYKNYQCPNGCSGITYFSTPKLDGLLWLIASHLESEYLKDLDNQSELKAKKAVLEAKIKATDTTTAKAEKSRQRAKELYIDGDLDKEQYKAKIDKINSEVKAVENKIQIWSEQINQIDKLLEQDKSRIEKVLTIVDKISSVDEKEMYTIVRKWITLIEVEDCTVTIHTPLRIYKAYWQKTNRLVHWCNAVDGSPLTVPTIERKGNAEVVTNPKLVWYLGNTAKFLSGKI